jgi:sugar lactone lactonase YvrE
MKNQFKKGLVLMLVVAILASFLTFASPATSYTYALNAKSRWTKTQDAYLPETTLVELGLNSPKDLFVGADDVLYIADTGNKRILKYAIGKKLVLGEIALDVFKTPSGVFVTNDLEIYVADAGASAVFRVSSEGELLETFGKPSEIAFGNTPFKPSKIAVDSKKNMYIIGEGVLNGIIQLSNGGRFLGYFATNRVKLNFVQEMQNLFFTDDQMKNVQSRLPITITNVMVDEDNIVYSTTIGFNADNRVAKHNTAGRNVFDASLFAPNDLSDVYVDSKGIIYASSLNGMIWIYSNDGYFIHAFGGKNPNESIAGLFSSLDAIAVDSEGKIWAADATTSYIQGFEPTDYSLLIYDAISSFNKGEYAKAEDLWGSVLKRNQMLRIGHDSLGKIYLYTERYQEAMKHLKIANNRPFYSQAFWEIRNELIQKNVSATIVMLAVLWILIKLIKLWDKRRGVLGPLKKSVANFVRIKWINDILFIFSFFRHPIDSFYDLKIKKKGSYLGATLIAISGFAIYLHSYIGRGFLYSYGPIEDIDFNVVVFSFVGLIGLFVITNYLVSSIKDGEGTLGDIYKMTLYALGPWILGIVSISIFSHLFTYNESFLIEMINLVTILWSFINIILGLQEIHNYSSGTALISVVISFGFMILIAIIAMIVLLMGEQVYDFFEVIIREVIRNVTQ